MDGFARSEPSLKVFAPTSQLAAARNSHRLQPGAGSESVTIPTSNPGFSGYRFPAAQEAINVQVAEPPLKGAQAIKSLKATPSWLVSMVFHLGMILLLAFCSFGQGSLGSIVLEIVESPADVEVLTTVLEFEELVIDDTSQLEPSDDLIPTESEIPTIPLELMETISSVSIQHNLTQLDAQLVSGLNSGGAGGGIVETAKSGRGAEFFGTKSDGSKFVFVIDCSGSMKGMRWYRAVKELNQAIEGLKADQQFLVLLYNTHTHVMLNAAIVDARLVNATQSYKDDCRKWLRGQKPNGGTFPAQAMYVALETTPDAIFLLSDGEIQDNTMGLLRFWNTEVESFQPPRKVPVHTISLGPKGQGQAIMRSIAHQNDGEFTWCR